MQAALAMNESAPILEIDVCRLRVCAPETPPPPRGSSTVSCPDVGRSVLVIRPRRRKRDSAHPELVEARAGHPRPTASSTCSCRPAGRRSRWRAKTFIGTHGALSVSMRSALVPGAGRRGGVGRLERPSTSDLGVEPPVTQLGRVEIGARGCPCTSCRGIPARCCSRTGSRRPNPRRLPGGRGAR